MKLIMLGPYPLDTNIANVEGGVQAVIVNLVKGLSRFDDLDIHIITASSRIDKDISFKSNGIDIHVVPLDRRFGNLTLYSRTRKRICKKIDQIKPDLIHTHMLRFYTFAVLNSAHKNVIVSTHGMANSKWGVSFNIIETLRQYSQYYSRQPKNNPPQNPKQNRTYYSIYIQKQLKKQYKTNL